MKTVIIIEDNKPLSMAYKDIVDSSESFRTINVYHNCEDAIDEIKQTRPDIVLMDVELPKMNGVEGTKKIKALRPNTFIIMVTVYENSKTVFDALCAGATGYLTKNSSPSQLIEALEEVIDGGAPMSINIAKMVVQSFQKAPTSILTERETEVLTLLSAGKSYKSIADLLFISKNTIKFHIKNIYDKLQVNSREDAIEKANNERLI